MTTPTADVGVTGLSTMGRNLARNLARRGYRVAVHNRTGQRTRELVERFGAEGTFLPAADLAGLVASLTRPRRLLLMVQAGPAVDATLDALLPLLDAGDVVVDGGNSHFADTRRREARLAAAGVHLVGAGISGGEEGALTGPSIMPGGSVAAYAVVGPLLEDIAARVDGVPCCRHVGPDGSGHFVKMVHNGIEYADMQLLAECYDLLRQVGGLPPAEVAGVFGEWNEGELESFLLASAATVLARVDPHTGAPFVDVVADAAEQKGTGRWTVQLALDLGSPVPGIGEAVFARVVSALVDQRRAAEPVLPGPRPQPVADAARLVQDGHAALAAARVVAFAQGFDLLRRGSEEYGWDLDLGGLATIWRGGCIIRARFLDRIRAAYAAQPALPNLLLDANLAATLGAAQEGWRRVVAVAVEHGVPTPVLSSSLAYYDALRHGRLPGALVQGLRDLFGAHGYRRTDRPGGFHTRWGGDGGEVALTP
ncbi:MAG: NADP-dependent phosphogluconate dehydrogenase [Actinomycetota bacterium]